MYTHYTQYTLHAYLLRFVELLLGLDAAVLSDYYAVLDLAHLCRL